MKIRYFLALSLSPQLGFAQDITTSNTQTSAPTQAAAGQCVIVTPVAPRRNVLTNADIESGDINVEADHAEAKMGKEAHFSGGVTFSHGERQIYAEEATLNRETQQLSAKGNLTLEDPRLTITADSIDAEIEANNAVMKGAEYWIKGQQVHGAARELEITPNNDLILSNSSFTTCPPGQESWKLQAGRIKINSEEEWGEIWNAKLKIADVPVLYIPYMSIPISDKRKSGLLFPKFSTSTINGVEVATPIYWNINPQYDLTYTPHYMSNRGLFNKLEFRYLLDNEQSGQLNVEYLPTDDSLNGSPNRYLYHWDHQGKVDDNWRFMANFTDVSDNNYFTDLDSDIRKSHDNQLIRVGEVNYLEKNWDLGLKVQDIKVLGISDKPYQVMPQLRWNYRALNVFKNINFSMYSEVSNFENKDNAQSSATRLHLEPSVILPIYGPAGSFTTELKLYQTNYWQDDSRVAEAAQLSPLDDSVSRTIPSVRIHGQINFEKQLQLFNQSYRQTLEPQAQYLYVGHQDQSKIGLYDSALLQEDYYGLFRDRRFSGLDRIADANQFTVGLTTRLFDEHNKEQMKFSFGQIFYLRDSRVNLNNSENIVNRPSSSVLAAELDAHIYNDWYLGSEIQYDTKNRESKKTEFTLDFRPENNKLFQLSYRFVPDLLNTNTNNQVDIAQAGTRVAWPIKDNLYYVGNWYYDLKQKRSVEAYTGFQYESCCWAVRLSYRYRIKANYDDNFTPTPDEREQFESGVYLNFVIKGLGSAGSLGVTDMLNDGIFNYRKPLYLRN
ncbi:LPS assembly protein LptD [Parashewanella spongiae]|uniref:LPS-assembly protein LptD n=1 Tax=Parashewanella spongiae TaxID=342950 RepID=A0A3A6U376_9GAMM|nr:LPS assembly protein LptD [Parashewanella spongiae]MCL1076672.1 LPS assembly protein LptD [Parashewanella spongiae]RJY18480.1 LPS assembly protein LptD [Parashewanella spongiae]